MPKPPQPPRQSNGLPPRAPVSELLQEGLRLHQSGRGPEAAVYYQRVLDREPAQPAANHLLGVVRLQQGRHDEAIRLMGRRGLPVPASYAERDWTQPYVASPEVEAAWLVAYRDPQHHWDLYQLGEELTDIEDAFRLWRFRHVTTVERVIGFKRGTGGTHGVSYLRKMLDVVLFPEIWSLRTAL